jgi:hypothetical protein
MMSATEKPKEDEDPVSVYGWNRDDATQKEKLNKLQQRHKDVAMRCYQWGYITTCADWRLFLATPTYWFKAFGAWLLSDEHKTHWLTDIVDRVNDKRSISVQDEILMWGNKLSMLKAHAPAADQTDLVVEDITEVLLGEAQTKLAYAQVLTKEAVEHLQKVNDSHSSVESYY